MRHHSVALTLIYALRCGECPVWQCKAGTRAVCFVAMCTVESQDTLNWKGACWGTGLHNSTFSLSCLGPQRPRLRCLSISQHVGPALFILAWPSAKNFYRSLSPGLPSSATTTVRAVTDSCAWWQEMGCSPFSKQRQWETVPLQVEFSGSRKG